MKMYHHLLNIYNFARGNKAAASLQRPWTLHKKLIKVSFGISISNLVETLTVEKVQTMRQLIMSLLKKKPNEAIQAVRANLHIGKAFTSCLLFK
jgi:hypothetical protein